MSQIQPEEQRNAGCSDEQAARIAWRKTFYPVAAEDFIKLDCSLENLNKAVDHCILKWSGLTPENLPRLGDGNLNLPIEISSETCALCMLTPTCKHCPIYGAYGRPCDSRSFSEQVGFESIASPYHEFLDRQNAEPMLQVLRGTKAFLSSDKGLSWVACVRLNL